MQINYYKEWSNYLNRDMEFKVFGHAGRPVMVFPCQAGRFYDWENFGMVEKAAWWLDRGELQLFCVDSIDSESWDPHAGASRRRIEMQEKWFNYLTQELYPRIIALNGGQNKGNVLTAGASMGAAHAVNIFLRRPDLFNGVIALSGQYATEPFFADYVDDLVYRNAPMHYIADLPQDSPLIAQYNQADPLLLCVGQGAWEDDALASTKALNELLESKGIHTQLELWGYDVSHDWSWWQKQWPMFLGRILDKTTPIA